MLKNFKKRQLDILGISFLLEELEPFTPYGIEKKKQIEFFSKDNNHELLLEYEYIQKFLKLYKEQSKIASSYEQLLKNIKEIRGILKKICTGDYILDDIELFEIKGFLIDTDKFVNALIKNNLEVVFSFDGVVLKKQKDLLKLLNPQDIIDRAFYIYDSFSPNLSKVRKHKKQSENEDEKQKYFELEKEEEEKIRKKLTSIIHTKIDDFYNNSLYIGIFDFSMAKARLARKFDGRCPQIENFEKIKAIKIRNPYVEKILLQKKACFKPIDIELSKGSNILTGANMGGKSVALNTLTLNIILALSGFFVYAQEFLMPHLEFVFFLSEDLQSVQRGLSTFGAEVVEIKKMIEDIESKVGVAILDEFARGTNPEEGTIICNGLLSYIQKYNSFCLFSTHYSNIGTSKMKHLQVKGLKNADFDKMKNLMEENTTKSLDVIQDFMDYSIENITSNYKTPQDAIKVAVLLGLKEDVIRCGNINKS